MNQIINGNKERKKIKTVEDSKLKKSKIKKRKEKDKWQKQKEKIKNRGQKKIIY